jgi:hypothetical protein
VFIFGGEFVQRFRGGGGGGVVGGGGGGVVVSLHSMFPLSTQIIGSGVLE